MISRLSFLYVAVVLGVTSTGVAAVQPPKRAASRAALKKVITLRGGDLGKVDGKTLAKAFSIMTGCDAVCSALVPRSSVGWFGIPIAKGSLSHKYLHGVGASQATICIATFLATTGRTSVEQAIAYGLVARLGSMSLMMLTDEEKTVGMSLKPFGALWLAVAATVTSLLWGFPSGDARTLTKVVSLVLGIHGLFLYLKPQVFLRKTVIAIGPDPLVEEFLSIDGGAMLASAICTGLLAQGVNPVKVTGYTAAAFVPVLYKMFEIIDMEIMWGVGSLYFAMGAIAILACIIVGTLQ